MMKLLRSIYIGQTYPHTPYPADLTRQQTVNSTNLYAELNNGTIYVSNPIVFTSEVPVGHRLYSTAFVLTNGIVYFSEDKTVRISGSPDLQFAFSMNQSLLAPYWADIIPDEGQVSYSLYENCGGPSIPSGATTTGQPNSVQDQVINKARQDVIRYHGLSDFQVDSVLVVTWSHVKPFSDFSKPGQVEQNTFQTVFISGWIKGHQGILSEEKMSYVLYIYKHGEMTWNYVPGRLCCYRISNEREWQLKQKNSLYIWGHLLSKDPWIGTEALDNILAHDTCCHNAPKSKCDQFYRILQNNNCSSHHSFANAYAFGDPHIITFDGLTYSMNGWGEFILMEVDGGEFSLQARTERVQTVNSRPANATIFIGFAAQEKYHSHFQVELSASGILAWRLGRHILNLAHNNNNKLILDCKAAASQGLIQPWKEPKVTGGQVKDHANASGHWYDITHTAPVPTPLDTGTTSLIGSCANATGHWYDITHTAPVPSPLDTGTTSLIGLLCQRHWTLGSCANATGHWYDITHTAPVPSPLDTGTTSLIRLLCQRHRTLVRHHSYGSCANTTGHWYDITHTAPVPTPLDTAMNILVNGKNLTEDFYRESNFLLSNANISVLREVRGNKDLVIAKFPCGVSLAVNVGIKNLELEVKVGNHLNKKVKGLLGYYSGTPSDDFKDPDGTSIHTNSPDPNIYSYIKDWAVSSTSTIFKYFNGDSHAQYLHPAFIPLYPSHVSSSQVEMSFCQSDKLCMFDYFATHDRNLAENTRTLNYRYKSVAEDLVNHPPTIRILNLDANGLWVVNDGSPAVLDVEVIDADHHNVKLELMEDNTEASISVTNHQLQYTPDANKPVIIRLRAVDDHNASSEIVTVNIGVCSDCNNHGTCAPNENDDLDYINGHFWRLKCACNAPYAGTDCKNFQGPCEIHPCSLGQNCTELNSVSPPQYTCGLCLAGYEALNGKCVDIDECSNHPKICGEHTCINMMGSYTCTCNKGFILDQNSKTCRDINECNYRPSVCQHLCINTPGGYGCSCLQDYSLNNDNITCHLDIDECSIGSHTCSQVCHNEKGYYTCSCKDGFTLHPDNHTCEACLFPYYGKNCLHQCNCNGHGTCNSTTGCVCDEHWSGPNCTTDVDECLIYHPCPSGQICNNTIGSYICSCPPGTQLVDGHCQDCAENFYGLSCALHCTCLNHQKCNKLDGNCSCMDGWTGQTCDIDIDECSNGSHSCNYSAHEICVNIPGGFFCTCDEGFGLNLVSGEKVCKECPNKTYGRNCSSSCSCHPDYTRYCDKINGTCYCKDGWEGPHCSIDINECNKNQNLCNLTNHEHCQNTDGSYVCSCQSGFHKDSGNTCIECSNGTFGSECQHQCKCQFSNTRYCDKINGFCNCTTGWTGGNCNTDVNECTEQTHNCSASNHEICSNEIGSFNCSCQNGFVLDHDGITCKDCQNGAYGSSCSGVCDCDLDHMIYCDKKNGTCYCMEGWEGPNCKTDINECLENPNHCNSTNHEICTNMPGSFDCSCEVGFHKDKGNTCIECHNGKYGTNCSSLCICDQVHSMYCDKTNGTCHCKDGWEGPGCRTDINECLINSNRCNSTNHKFCSNKPGSFDCSCEAGYHKDNEGTCIECPAGTYGYNCSTSCHCKESKTNVCNKISGMCTCLNGWYGSDCSLDIDECTDNKDSCDISKHELCVNTNGSFICSCQPGYTLDASGKICVESHTSHVVLLNLTFKYEGNLYVDQIKLDVESTFFNKLQGKYAGIQKILVLDIRKGSLKVDCNITLKNEDNYLKSSLDHLAQALYQVEKENDDLLINNQPAVLMEAILESFKVDKSTSPCEVKENFDPCQFTESCQDQGIDAICVMDGVDGWCGWMDGVDGWMDGVDGWCGWMDGGDGWCGWMVWVDGVDGRPIVKKDHLNFIIGMSVGLSGFALLCAFIGIMTRFWVTKKQTSVEPKKKVPQQHKKDSTKRSLKANTSSVPHSHNSKYKANQLGNDNRSHQQPDINRSHQQPDINRSHHQPDINRSHHQPNISTSYHQPNINRSDEQPNISRPYQQPNITRSHQQPNINQSNQWPIISNSQENLPKANDHQYKGVYPSRSEANKFQNVNRNQTELREFQVRESITPVYTEPTARHARLNNDRNFHRDSIWQINEDQEDAGPITRRMSTVLQARDYSDYRDNRTNNIGLRDVETANRFQSLTEATPELDNFQLPTNQRPTESLHNKRNDPLISRRYSRDPYLHY
ncbi:hypothetical protein Btru_054657 [Bulinus truncatus]|nr:hypothetical protein Btru_054657 [Bulinus truncatus]